MKKLTPYLFFAGNCREAISFYKQVFGGKLEIMSYGDGGSPCPDAMKGQIMHACLSSGDFMLFASDSPKGEVTVGTNVQITVDCEKPAELDATFQSLAEGGHRLAEPRDEFWGQRFAVLKDRFGVQWMLTSPVS